MTFYASSLFSYLKGVKSGMLYPKKIQIYVHLKTDKLDYLRSPTTDQKKFFNVLALENILSPCFWYIKFSWIGVEWQQFFFQMHFAAWVINKEISLRSISRFFFGLEPRYSIVVVYTVFEKFSCLIYL